MRWIAAGFAATTAIVAAPVSAGDQVLYEAAPGWAAPAAFDKAVNSKEPLVLFDKQVRLEGGTVHNYSDLAYRIDNPDALAQLGTLKLVWQPDKGDLTVHRLEIVRGGRVIDLLAQGARYDVLRRESELEKRSLDGSLTATIAAPGLQVGDVLRFSQTISRRDQALDGEVQVSEGLLTEPTKMGFGRLRISWPDAEPMRWKANGGFSLDDPAAENGYRVIDVALPLAKPDETPDDAPARFRMRPMVQVTSYDGWEEVSRRLSPYFSTEGTIEAGGPIAAQVARIRAAAGDPREQAALALRLVQDEVSYLLDGLNGGNYLPQAPALTWDKRYGDCKAKSLLLLAILRELGIESEVVLVNSKQGDAVPEYLPLPGDFDHMIVHAVIGGRDFWLDGTSGGTRIDTMEEVPAFDWALPLRREGAALVAIEQRWPAALDRVLRVTYDYRAGLDLPALYEAEVEARGVFAARIRPHVDQKDQEERLNYTAEYLKDIVGEGLVYETRIAYDEDSGVATIKAKGLLDSPWKFERGKGSLALAMPSTGMEFNPDRARTAWREIPYRVGGPLGFREVATVLLPDGGKGYELSGLGNFSDEVGGVRVERAAELADGKLTISDTAVKIPREIAVADLAQEKSKHRRLVSGDPLLRAPDDARRYWQVDPKAATARFAALEKAYAQLIAIEPDDAWRWEMRAWARRYGPDLAGALADYDKAIALEATADRYTSRSGVYEELGKLDRAEADARTAYELEPDLGSVYHLARLISLRAGFDDALALLEEFDLSGDDRVTLLQARAEIAGESGRKDEGWALLEEGLAERPDDGELLNAQCWYMGTWQYRLDEALETCDRAVEKLAYSAGALDSRALVKFRLGRADDAMKDLDAALRKEPGQAASLYLAGIIGLERGERDARRSIDEAARIWAGIGRDYQRYGIAPKE